MPIYLSKFQGKETLIKASTIAGARNHVLKPLVPEIAMLDAEGVADAMGRGLTVEDASADGYPAPSAVDDGEKGK